MDDKPEMPATRFPGVYDMVLVPRGVLAEVREALRASIQAALRRPHDGSQLDEDLEGVLLGSRAALAKLEGVK
jgi:hypothetical protein